MIVVRVELTWGTNPTIIILPRLADTNRLSYCPRSVHTHFQGLCVVFGLLISIPSARLTEQCCSHLLWLCESAESDLITSVGWDFRPSLLHLYYTTLLWICQEVFEKKLQFFSIFSSKAPRSNGYYLFCSPQALATIPVGEFPFRRANRLCFAPLTTLLTLLLYHKTCDLSRGF